MLNFKLIKTQLMGVICVLIGAGGVAGACAWMIAQEGEHALQTVYADRVIPLNDLKAVSDAYAVAVVDNAHKVRSGAVTWSEGRNTMEASLEHAKSDFQKYLDTEMDDGERRASQAANTAIEKASPSLGRLQRILQTQDQAALDNYVTTELYATIDPVTVALETLTDIQVTEAREAYDKATRDEQTMLFGLMIMIVVNAAIGFGGIWLIRRNVLRPIKTITDTMTSLADGDFTVSVPSLQAENEIGEMARAVEVFKVNGIERERLEAVERDAVALREQRARTIENLVQQFNVQTTEIIGVVSTAATELEASAHTLTSGAEETSKQSIVVSAASEEASVNVQTVAAAAEEMAATVNEISRQVQSSVIIANEAVRDAAETADVVRQLSGGAQRIGEIVSLITNVASQTNLLALNATIEAARAGAAGSGFAVVAGEVKGLAAQTANASAQIGKQIEEIQTITRDAVTAIGKISQTIENMASISTSISAAVEEQSATTQEIARNVQQASVGASEVTQNISGITRATEETSAAASQVLGASGELAQQSSRLRQEVAVFVDRIQSA